jgi:hypothetical protein
MMGECERDALWREENEADNLKDYLDEIIEVIYGRTDIDVGRDELVRYIRDLKDAELLLNEADSDTYNMLQRRYDEKFG